MSIPTVRVEEIRDAAQELLDTAEELIGYREDPDADREDKANANDEFETAIRTLLSVMPKIMLADAR